MCIYCKCGDSGSKFLDNFAVASIAISEATKSMLECAHNSQTKEVKKHYDAIHKKMVKLGKDWNRLEHLRERCGK